MYNYAILNDQSFNDTLTNDIVSFEQLDPGYKLSLYVPRPRTSSTSITLKRRMFITCNITYKSASCLVVLEGLLYDKKYQVLVLIISNSNKNTMDCRSFAKIYKHISGSLCPYRKCCAPAQYCLYPL